jgi:hypothetical protein
VKIIDIVRVKAPETSFKKAAADRKQGKEMTWTIQGL